jgi:hypothetical protein
LTHIFNETFPNWNFSKIAVEVWGQIAEFSSFQLGTLSNATARVSFKYFCVGREKKRRKEICFKLKKASDKKKKGRKMRGGDEIHQENVFLCEIRYASASCSVMGKKLPRSDKKSSQISWRNVLWSLLSKKINKNLSLCFSLHAFVIFFLVSVWFSRCWTILHVTFDKSFGGLYLLWMDDEEDEFATNIEGKVAGGLLKVFEFM